MEPTVQNLQIDEPSSGQSMQPVRSREKLPKNAV